MTLPRVTELKATQSFASFAREWTLPRVTELKATQSFASFAREWSERA
jgi:hypothetical protein